MTPNTIMLYIVIGMLTFNAIMMVNHRIKGVEAHAMNNKPSGEDTQHTLFRAACYAYDETSGTWNRLKQPR